MENNRLAFVFRTSRSATGCIDFKSYPSTAGRAKLKIGEGKDSIVIDQFVYP